jgi:hypothetical protein
MNFWLLLLSAAVIKQRYGSWSMRKDLGGFDGSIESAKVKRSVEVSGEGGSELLDTSSRDRL